MSSTLLTRIAASFTVSAVLCVGANTAHATLIDFNSLAHGEIVTTQFAPTVTISAVNPNRPHDLAIIFDSEETGTADPDLEGPPWAGGNLAPGTVLGKLLIIAENDVDANNDNLIDSPDDEGSRPAGSLIFEFGQAVGVFGFDIIDIEGSIQEASTIEFFSGNTLLTTVSFADFVAAGPLFDPTVVFGNNTANRISPLVDQQLGIVPFDKVVMNLGGSSAIDNIIVPEPSTFVLGAIALTMFLVGRSRRSVGS